MITTEGGPAIPERLDRRQEAFDDTAWVRDALAAHHGQASSSRLTNDPGLTAGD